MALYRYDGTSLKRAEQDRNVEPGPITGKQYFIRDAQGNVPATYTYGSILKWRRGTCTAAARSPWSHNKAIAGHAMLPLSETDALSDWYLLGTMYHASTNPLSNVLRVIIDKKKVYL
ncbi:MAG TPA: hypothetical protein VFX43_10435 [Chitinophagaceae bacterium]|nr:hypothetical protein [Chitinophagaceae bacterium]